MKTFAVAWLTLLLVGCMPSEPSPFIGEWQNTDGPSSLRIKADGECRYMMARRVGTDCEWTEDNRRIDLTIKQGDVFIEVSGSLAGDRLHTMWPHGLERFER